MPWKERKIMDCRMEFINELLKKEVSIKYLCEQFGISEKTGHKWKNRFFEYGLIGRLLICQKNQPILPIN